MKLIFDNQLLKIAIKDNGEKLFYIKNFCPKITLRLATYIKKEGKKSREDACFVRKSVADRMNQAQSFLPKGYKLLLRCGYRSLLTQKRRYNWMYKRLEKRYPEWNKEKLRDETSKCVAPPDIVPPHSTGGAVDVSIIGPNGKQLDMGEKLGAFNEKTYTFSDKISKTAKKNRKLLILVMTKAGFINYPTEWWHWSYGDRYWAAALKKKHSIYNSV